MLIRSQIVNMDNENLFTPCLTDAIASLPSSHAKFASQIGVSKASVSKWISGELPTADRLSDVLKPFNEETRRLLLRHWIVQSLGSESLQLLQNNATSINESSQDSIDAVLSTLPPSTQSAIRTIVNMAQKSQDFRDYLQNWAKVFTPSNNH